MDLAAVEVAPSAIDEQRSACGILVGVVLGTLAWLATLGLIALVV